MNELLRMLNVPVSQSYICPYRKTLSLTVCNIPNWIIELEYRLLMLQITIPIAYEQ